MPTFDIFLLPFLAVALVFSIIELGLSAYTVSVGSRYSRIVYSYDPNYAGEGYGGYDTYGESVAGHAANCVDFLLFDSLWTMLVVVALVVLPRLPVNRARPAVWMAPLTLALNVVTMIFWLAGFAALADYLGGGAPQGIAGALLAFAVMLWLMFLALVVFNFLIAFGVLQSEHSGYHMPMFKKNVARTTPVGHDSEKNGPALTTAQAAGTAHQNSLYPEMTTS